MEFNKSDLTEIVTEALEHNKRMMNIVERLTAQLEYAIELHKEVKQELKNCKKLRAKTALKHQSQIEKDYKTYLGEESTDN